MRFRPLIHGITTSKCDPAIGDWIEVSWRPERDHPLAYLVDCIWHREGTITCPSYRRLPHGQVEVGTILEGGCARVRGDSIDVLPSFFVAGQNIYPEILLTHSGRFRTIGIGLHPEGARLLSPYPPDELADQILPVDVLGGDSAEELLEHLALVPQGAEAVTSLVEWLAATLPARKQEVPIQPVVSWAVKKIINMAGGTSVADLIDQAGVSESTFTRHFRQSVGMTPKRFARLHRFRRTLELLRNPGIRLAQVALIGNYYDQAHMSNEVKALSGLTPLECRQSVKYPSAPYRVFTVASNGSAIPDTGTVALN